MDGSAPADLGAVAAARRGHGCKQHAPRPHEGRPLQVSIQELGARLSHVTTMKVLAGFCREPSPPPGRPRPTQPPAGLAAPSLQLLGSH